MRTVHLVLLVVATAMISTLLPQVSADAHPGHCLLEGRKYHDVKFTGAEQDYWMGTSVNKHNGNCSDLNIRYTTHTAYYRGAYQSSSGTWYWSSVGRVWINHPAEQPFPVITNVAATTRITAGSTERDRAWNNIYSRWLH